MGGGLRGLYAKKAVDIDTHSRGCDGGRGCKFWQKLVKYVYFTESYSKIESNHSIYHTSSLFFFSGDFRIFYHAPCTGMSVLLSIRLVWVPCRQASPPVSNWTANASLTHSYVRYATLDTLNKMRVEFWRLRSFSCRFHFPTLKR